MEKTKLRDAPEEGEMGSTWLLGGATKEGLNPNAMGPTLSLTQIHKPHMTPLVPPYYLSPSSPDNHKYPPNTFSIFPSLTIPQKYSLNSLAHPIKQTPLKTY